MANYKRKRQKYTGNRCKMCKAEWKTGGKSRRTACLKHSDKKKLGENYK